MNKGYAAGDIERKAREVLGALQVTCPDAVWQDLNIELEQKHGALDAKWKNKLYTPQTLIIVLVLLSGSALGVWKYLSSQTDKQPIVVKKPAAPTPKVTPPPVQNTPPPVVKKDSVIPKHDSVVPLKVTPPPVAANVKPQTPAVNNNVPPLTDEQKQIAKAKHDSLMAARAAYREHWRDSVNVVRVHKKHIADSIKGINAAHTVKHDSVVVKHDSVN